MHCDVRTNEFLISFKCKLNFKWIILKPHECWQYLLFEYFVFPSFVCMSRIGENKKIEAQIHQTLFLLWVAATYWIFSWVTAVSLAHMRVRSHAVPVSWELIILLLLSRKTIFDTHRTHTDTGTSTTIHLIEYLFECLKMKTWQSPPVKKWTTNRVAGWLIRKLGAFLPNKWDFIASTKHSNWWIHVEIWLGNEIKFEKWINWKRIHLLRV